MPLFGIFGVFASAAVLSVVLVLLIRPRETDPAMTADPTAARVRARRALAVSRRRLPARRKSCRRRPRFLAANGIRTVFITGTTGECHALTRAERLALYEAWASAGAGARPRGDRACRRQRPRRRPGAGAPRRARSGSSAISTLPPSYDKPRTLADLIAWCATIAAEAPALPFYYYDIPSMTGVAFPIDRFLVEAPARIPTLAGVKFSNPDLVAYRRSLDAPAGRFDLPWGVDEALLGALATGARGGVGSTYNFAPRLYVELTGRLRARRSRRRPGGASRMSIAMVDALAATGFMGTSKALMGRLGVPVGPARAPHRNPSRRRGGRRAGAARRARLRRVGRDRGGLTRAGSGRIIAA